jgi:hypothetical protein
MFAGKTFTSATALPEALYGSDARLCTLVLDETFYTPSFSYNQDRVFDQVKQVEAQCPKNVIYINIADITRRQSSLNNEPAYLFEYLAMPSQKYGKNPFAGGSFRLVVVDSNMFEKELVSMACEATFTRSNFSSSVVEQDFKAKLTQSTSKHMADRLKTATTIFFLPTDVEESTVCQFGGDIHVRQIELAFAKAGIFARVSPDVGRHFQRLNGRNVESSINTLRGLAARKGLNLVRATGLFLFFFLFFFCR